MEAEFPVTINHCCMALIVKQHVLKMWLVPTAWSCWFLCMRISFNSLGTCIQPVPGMACLLASLFPICQGKTQGQLQFYPSFYARKLCSNSLHFFIFSVRCYDTIYWVREVLLLWWWFASWVFFLGVSRKKNLIGIAAIQYAGQKCVFFCVCSFVLQRVTAVDQSLGHCMGWNKEYFTALQPPLLLCRHLHCC